MSDEGIFRYFSSGQELSIAVAMPVALLLGICFAVTPVAGRTILSATAPAGQQGRVFAMQGTFTDMLCLAPLALTGVSTELAGARVTFMFVGIVGIALFALLELTQLGKIRHLLPVPSHSLG
jgi:hypothetical protein